MNQQDQPDVVVVALDELPSGVVKPKVVAEDKLSIAIPPHKRRVRGYHALADPGVRIAIAAGSTALGMHTRQVLARFPAAERARIRANIVAILPDGPAVARAVAGGEVDAGLLYNSQIRGESKIDLPLEMKPRVFYSAAVVAGAAHPRAARAFIARLRTDAGQAMLKRAGFTPS
jgi:ABC-type molybdate transport system substrate-binding protein